MTETMTDCPLDLAEALARTGGDQDFLRELLEMLVDDVPGRITSIRQAVAQQDADTVRAEAHTLKGAAANLAAARLAELALAVEQCGRSGELDGVEPLLAGIERESERVGSFARTLSP